MNPAEPQRAPLPGGTRILDLVLREMTERAETGRDKYGTYLQANNGRNPLIDAYQEAQDLCMYLRQAIEEGDRVAEERKRFIALLMDTAQRWNIYAAANQKDHSRVVHALAAESCCLDLATEVRSWTERSEPTEAAPSAAPEPG